MYIYMYIIAIHTNKKQQHLLHTVRCEYITVDTIKHHYVTGVALHYVTLHCIILCCNTIQYYAMHTMPYIHCQTYNAIHTMPFILPIHTYIHTCIHA